jgi:cytidylate kinase
MRAPVVTIAVDGPSGSGKSSVSRAVATRLGLAYLDTGAMYRAATLWCVRSGVALDDAGAVATAVVAMPLEMGVDPAAPTVRLDGDDVAEAIRTTEVSSVVSQVATNLDVRAELRRRQRAVIEAEATGGFSGGRGVVAEGRDITTVVAPDAPVRILLTADEGVRAARRSAELVGSSTADVGEQIRRRDEADARVVDFMTAAEGVTTVDSTELDFDQTVEAVIGVIRSFQPVTG